MSLGQTHSTNVSYLKALRPLFTKAITMFSYADDTFPRVDTFPDRSVLDKIKFTMDVLSEKYKGAGKMSTQEQFTSKVLDVDSLPSFTLIKELVEKMRSDLLINLEALEEIFNKTTMKIDVSAKVIDGRKTNLQVMCLIIFFALNQKNSIF